LLGGLLTLRGNQVPTLENKTLFITGATRGIGHAIGMRAAADGANIVIAAKTVEPHPKLPGTIYTAAEDMERAGGKALAIQMDVREEDSIRDAMAQAAETFGGIDILVNNASAINLTNTPNTPMKRFDLMMGVNMRGTYAATQAALPFLKEAANPHVLTLSSPLNMNPRWFGPHVAYTMAKYGMSMCVLGHAEEFKPLGIGVNGLWPKTLVATAALQMIPGVDAEMGRKPEIMADAAHAVLTRDAKTCTGNFFIDEDVLRQEGVTDFTPYAVNPDKPLLPDLFLD
jgi:citronellol/citronellal dehydrogenase